MPRDRATAGSTDASGAAASVHSSAIVHAASAGGEDESKSGRGGHLCKATQCLTGHSFFAGLRAGGK